MKHNNKDNRQIPEEKAFAELLAKQSFLWDTAIDGTPGVFSFDDVEYSVRKKVVRDLNKLVYDTAEKHGVSVWMVVACFRPKITFEGMDHDKSGGVTAKFSLQLELYRNND